MSVYPGAIDLTSDSMKASADMSSLIDRLEGVNAILVNEGFSFPGNRSVTHCLANLGLLNPEDQLDSILKPLKLVVSDKVMVVGWSGAAKLAAKMVEARAWDQVVHHEALCDKDPSRDMTVSIIKKALDEKAKVVLLNCLGRFTVRPTGGEEKISTFQYQGSNKTHIQGGVRIATLEELDNLCAWVRSLCKELKNAGIFPFVIPPNPKYFDRCCKDFDHFVPEFDPELHFRMTMALNEYLARHAGLRYGKSGHNVLLWSSILPGIHYSGEQLCNDGVHLSYKSNSLLVRALVRNRVSLGRFDLINLDLNAPSPNSPDALPAIHVPFSEFFSKIPSIAWPRFSVPPRLEGLNTVASVAGRQNLAKKPRLC